MFLLVLIIDFLDLDFLDHDFFSPPSSLSSSWLLVCLSLFWGKMFACVTLWFALNIDMLDLGDLDLGCFLLTSLILVYLLVWGQCLLLCQLLFIVWWLWGWAVILGQVVGNFLTLVIRCLASQDGVVSRHWRYLSQYIVGPQYRRFEVYRCVVVVYC